jgi:hypothetical protein
MNLSILDVSLLLSADIIGNDMKLNIFFNFYGSILKCVAQNNKLYCYINVYINFAN